VAADSAATPAANSATPNLSVYPASGLTDGQTVQVTGAGFEPATQIAIRQCLAGATSGDACVPVAATVAPTGLDGSFSTSVVVSRDLSIGAATVDCEVTGACVLQAGYVVDPAVAASAPIAFGSVAAIGPEPAIVATSYYLALGDSLATGFAAPPGQGYVDHLAAFYARTMPGLQVEDLGCNGETTATFLNGGQCPYAQGSQLAAAEAFLAGHRGQVALITIDIGGDDISGCASRIPPFAISPDCVSHAVSQVSANLRSIGAALRTAAGPSVPIAGMTYFDPFVVEWLTGADGQAAAQTSIADLGQLNATLIDAYGSFGAVVADVSGAFSASDLTDLVSSPYGNVPKAVSLACSWLFVLCTANGTVIVGVHPNATGYGVIADAFEQVVPVGALVLPPPTPSAPPPSGPVLASTGFSLMRDLVAGLAMLALGGALVWRFRRAVRAR